MNTPKQVFLFDIDGVLVEPLGYRAAVHAALRHFTRQMALPDRLIPDEDIIALYESQRITSEWDMVPLSLAILLDGVMASFPDQILLENLPPTIPETCSYLRQFRLQPGEIDYRTPILRLGANLRAGEVPSETALRLAWKKPGEAVEQQKPLEQPAADIFPFLKGHDILAQLLANTRDPTLSRTTRIFQHYSLGSEIFAKTYQLPAEFETPSLLQTNDRPMLPDDLHDELLVRSQQDGLAIAAYTMRPSLPPRGAAGIFPGYPPEAEMALELVRMEQFPLIGHGRIRYLAEKTGVDTESYIKPSPVQALAAILAAITGEEIPALELAARIHGGSPFPGLKEWMMVDAIEIHVFEDTPGGIEAARSAVQSLDLYGIAACAHNWGIATHPDKVAALKAIGAPVFASTQDAVSHALSVIY